MWACPLVLSSTESFPAPALGWGRACALASSRYNEVLGDLPARTPDRAPSASFPTPSTVEERYSIGAAASYFATSNALPAPASCSRAFVCIDFPARCFRRNPVVCLRPLDSAPTAPLPMWFAGVDPSSCVQLRIETRRTSISLLSRPNTDAGVLFRTEQGALGGLWISRGVGVVQLIRCCVVPTIL